MPFLLPSVFAFRPNEDWPVVVPVAVPCVLGAAAVFLLLPKPSGGRTAILGALVGGLGLLLAAYLLLSVGVFSPETALFYTFSALTVVGGVALVTQRNPARAALSFALVVLSTCGLFLLLAAPFLMAATIIIYAGAIIVTFLFVLMLAAQAGVSNADARTREPLLATALGFLLLGCLIYVLQMSYEENQAVKEMKKQLSHVRKVKANLADDNLATLEALPSRILTALNDARDDSSVAAGNRAELAEVSNQIRAIYSNEELWPMPRTANVATMRDALSRLEATLDRAIQRHGWLGPLSPDSAGLSDLSGPAALGPTAEWRSDEGQRAPLPADNSAFLGRSLFTDFLLPVELGGVLLLVATIGAIAIAHRRTTPARPS